MHGEVRTRCASVVFASFLFIDASRPFNTPNGIIVLNEALEVQQINSAARKIMNIRNASDVLGDQVIRILDPKVFLDVMQTGRSIHDEKVYLAEYQKYVEQSVIYDKSYRIVMCIMRDVTEEEHERIQKEKISQHTIESQTGASKNRCAWCRKSLPFWERRRQKPKLR